MYRGVHGSSHPFHVSLHSILVHLYPEGHDFEHLCVLLCIFQYSGIIHVCIASYRRYGLASAIHVAKVSKYYFQHYGTAYRTFCLGSDLQTCRDCCKVVQTNH